MRLPGEHDVGMEDAEKSEAPLGQSLETEDGERGFEQQDSKDPITETAASEKSLIDSLLERIGRLEEEKHRLREKVAQQAAHLSSVADSHEGEKIALLTMRSVAETCHRWFDPPVQAAETDGQSMITKDYAEGMAWSWRELMSKADEFRKNWLKTNAVISACPETRAASSDNITTVGEGGSMSQAPQEGVSGGCPSGSHASVLPDSSNGGTSSGN